MAEPRTLFAKVWDAHTVDDGLLFIDLHLIHEVTSPQAFAGLRRPAAVRRPDRTLAIADHNVPTTGSARAIADQARRAARDAGPQRRGVRHRVLPLGDRGRASSTWSGPSRGAPSRA